MPSAQPDYVMGHTDHERRWLALQAAVINPLTDSFLRRAGISAGMHVLELGCGIGEVTLITARLVGPHGHVRSLDIDGTALEIAQGRIRSAGHDHVKFEQTDINGITSDYRYDAVIGRHILIHTPDPLDILRKAVSMVHAGGVIAFQEFDLSYCPRPCPDLPLWRFALDLIVRFFCRGVPNPDMGARLFHLMQEAELPPPECRAESIMDGGPFSPVYEWLAETVRSLLPRLEELGLTTAAEVDVDTLAQRMRQEALDIRSAVVVCPMIGAFARKPR
jgi:ubiquinone/menaquinone biosynthesis C-methylase UbiE